MGCFTFDRGSRRFRLDTVHPTHSLDSILSETGFSFDHAQSVPTTPLPEHETVEMIGSEISDEVAEVYPKFAVELKESAAALLASMADRG
jgi:glutaconate CoA-transferase subunit B